MLFRQTRGGFGRTRDTGHRCRNKGMLLKGLGSWALASGKKLEEREVLSKPERQSLGKGREKGTAKLREGCGLSKGVRGAKTELQEQGREQALALNYRKFTISVEPPGQNS